MTVTMGWRNACGGSGGIEKMRTRRLLGLIGMGLVMSACSAGSGSLSANDGGPGGGVGGPNDSATVSPYGAFVGTWKGTVQYTSTCTGPCQTGQNKIPPYSGPGPFQVSFDVSPTGMLLSTEGPCSPIPFSVVGDTASTQAGFGSSRQSW